jgi:hypothetical protein
LAILIEKLTTMSAAERLNRTTIVFAPFLNLKIRCSGKSRKVKSKGMVAGNRMRLA